jgi:hypothetical protein
MLREPSRWLSPMGSWVLQNGVYQVAEQLAQAGHPVTGKAIYNWIAGESLPRPRLAARLCHLSGGELTLRDVYLSALEAEGLLEVR